MNTPRSALLRRLWLRRTGLMLCAVVLAGCAGLTFREPVQVNVVGLDPAPGEGMEVRMTVKLRVQNPNDAALDFDGVSLSLDLRGSRFATGVSPDRGSIPRFGETVIRVPVSVSAWAAVRQIIGLATNETTRVDYVLRGRLSTPGLGGVPFESRGELDLPGGLGGTR